MVSIKEPVHFDRLSSGHSPLHPPTSVRFSPSSSRLDSSLDQLGGKKKKRWIRPFFARRNRWWRPVDVRTSFLFFFFGRPYILYDRLLLLLYVGQRERDVSYYYSCRIIVSLIGTWTGPSRNRSQRKRRTTFLYVNSIHGHPSSFNSRSFSPLFWDDGKETSVSLNRWKMSKMKSSRGHRSASKAAASR